jgi:hypothetical protein
MAEPGESVQADPAVLAFLTRATEPTIRDDFRSG